MREFVAQVLAETKNAFVKSDAIHANEPLDDDDICELLCLTLINANYYCDRVEVKRAALIVVDCETSEPHIIDLRIRDVWPTLTDMHETEHKYKRLKGGVERKHGSTDVCTDDSQNQM